MLANRARVPSTFAFTRLSEPWLVRRRRETARLQRLLDCNARRAKIATSTPELKPPAAEYEFWIRSVKVR